MTELSTQDVLALTQKLGLSVDNVEKQHAAFIDKYPSGEMKKEDFVAYILEKDDMAEEETAASLFEIFDKDSSGTMDFAEFLMASHATKLKTVEDKLNWIFDVFDRDAGGTIDPKELHDIVHGLFCLAGMEVPDEILDIRSKEMSDAIDVDGDGEITKEEFIKNAMECEFVCDMLQVGIGEFDDDDDDEEDDGE